MSLLIFCFYLAGQVVNANIPNSFQNTDVVFFENHPLLSIPFTFDGRIVIPLKISGSNDMDIILDSGFPQKTMMLLMHKEIGEQLELKYARTQNLARGGGSGDARPVHLAPGVDVTLSQIDLGKMLVGVLDESRETSVHHNKGVFGGAVFLPYVVKIDFNTSRLTLYDPETYQFKDVISSLFGKNEIKDTMPILEELQCDGIIGIGCLYRFNMIFDYAHNRLFIKPNKYFYDPFEMNMAGMAIEEMGSGAHVVYFVVENSPASDQELRKGDVLEKVNGKNIDLFDYLELKKVFEQDGKTVKIQIRRDGKSQKIKLRLKRII